MSRFPLIKLKELIRVEYGSALRSTDRDGAGKHIVYGSNGPVGRHESAIVEHPTIIIGRKGSVGSLTYAPEGGWPIDTTYYTEIINHKQLDLRYLFYGLIQARLDQHTIVTSIPGLNRDAIYRTEIPLPSLAEQKRIAAILDKADAIRRRRQESLATVDCLSHALFLEMFGPGSRSKQQETVVPIKECAIVQGGIALSQERQTLSLQVPYLRVANVFRDRLELGEIKTIGVTDDEFQRTRLRAGDVLVVEGHGNREEVGRSAVWTGEVDPCIHQNHLIRLRADSQKILPEYLNAYINSDEGRSQLFRHGKTTSGLNTISLSNVRDTNVFLPPLSHQMRFVRAINYIRQTRGECLDMVKHCNALLESLVRRAFRGEL